MADEEWVPIPLGSVGGQADEEWAPIDVGFSPKSPPQPGLASEFGRGVVRGAGNALGFPILEGIDYAARGIADASGNQTIQQFIEPKQQRIRDARDQFNRDWGASVPSVTDIGGVGDTARYVAGTVGELLPIGAGYVGSFAAGGPAGAMAFGVSQGALQGATEAARKYNGDPAAVATGAIISAIAGGATVPFLMGKVGQGILQHAVRAAIGSGGTEVAEELAQPIAGVAAGQGYTPPSGAQIADALAAGGIMGGVFGGIGGMHGRHKSAEPMEVTTGVTPDVQVALNEALQLPAPLKQLPAPQQQAMPLGLPRPETMYGDGFIARPTVPEPQPMMLPRPETGYGDGFTMPPPWTPAPPLDPQLTGPVRHPALEAPDLARGASGEGFTVQQQPSVDAEPARPSGGMNRGNLIEELTGLGEDPKRLKRLKITELRDTYDRHMTPAEPALHEFRPETTVTIDDVPAGSPADNAVPRAAAEPVQSELAATPDAVAQNVDAPTDPAGQTAAVAAPAARPETAAPALMVGAEQTEAPAPQPARSAPAADQPIAALMTTDQVKPQTVGDRLKAKRQLEKERMAAPRLVKRAEAPAKKPEVRIEDELETENGTGIDPETVNQARRGVEQWARKTVEKDNAGGEEFDTEKMTQWALRGFDDALAGTRRRGGSADHWGYYDGGANFAERMIEARKAAHDVEDQPQVYESDAGTTTVVNNEAPVERPRSAQTTNKDRILADLESKIANKLMTAAEASEEYGSRASGPGRARKHPDLASYLRERVEKAPQEERRLLDEETRITEDRKIPAEKRQALVREITAKRDQHSPDHVEKLREALHELENPPAEDRAEHERRMTDKKSAVGAKLAALRAKKSKHDSVAERNRVSRPVDERENRPVRTLLDKSDSDNGSHSVHDYLDAVSDDPVLKVRRPQDVALARWLRSVLPADLQVMTQKAAAEYYGDSSYIDDKIAGTHYYEPGVRDLDVESIVLNSNPDLDSVTTLLHESMHAATTHYLDALSETAPARQALREIATELQRHLDDNPAWYGSKERKTAEYALSDPYELHTMLMTDPELQRIAAEAVPSPDFNDRLEKIGYSAGPPRSIWRAFTDWVRKLVKLPRGMSDSLLDRIMRPLQDIADEAATFNRASLDVLPRDPQLRAAAEPTLEAASRALPVFDKGKVKDYAINKIDIDGKNDKLRPVWLQLATTDAIVTRFRNLFKTEDGNPLEDLRSADEAAQARTRELRDRYSDRVNKLIDRIKGPDRDALASLMNDATLAEAHLGGGDNTHLKSPEQQAELAKLEARYNALPDAAKKLYGEWRDHYRETYTIERKASLASIIKSALPDATKAQVDALTEAVRTRRGIKQLIDNPDKSPVAAAFADAWHSKRSLVREIAKVHDQGFVLGDFFPLARYGDYVIHYGNKGSEDYGVEMFERRADAQARLAELKKAGLDPSDVLDRRQSKLRVLVPESMLSGLNQALESAKFTESQRDTVRDAFAAVMMQHANRAASTRHRMRRHGIKGASLEVEKTLARDMLDFAARVGYLDHGPGRAAALSAMRRHADYLGRTREDGSQIKASAVIGELEQRGPSNDDAAPGTLSHRMRQFSTFGWVYSLMSPSQMVVNTVEAHANSISMIGGRHGVGRSGIAVAKALKELGPKMIATGGRNTFKAFGEGLKAADWNLANHARDQLIKAGADKAAMTDLFNRLNNAGLINHSMVRELQRIANPGADITKGWWGKFMDFEGAMNHAVDVANKAAIAKAAYDLELRKTGDHKAAVKYAIEMSRQAMPNYNVVNKSRIATDKGALGSYAAPIMQFKNYGLHMYGVMANLAHQSMHGASKADKREARIALAGILATRSLMAGTLTLVADPLRYVMGLYDWITGADRPHDYQADLRLWIAEAFGPTLGEVFSRGLPRAAGMDWSRRTGMGNMLNMPDIQSYDMSGYMTAMATAMSGVAAQDALKMAEGAQKIINGDVSKGIIDFIPVRMARDMVKAGMLNAEGVTDPSGRTIMDPERLSAGNIASQALGFQPARVAEFREQRNAIAQARKEREVERGRLTNRYVTADPSDRADVMDRVREYNRQHPGDPITVAQLRRAVNRQRQTVQDPKTAGLHLPKRAARDLIERGSFANVQ